ncbi:MAG: hypothetical protein KDM91_13765 [Verrucomicrobiae bacterium]|nr:hypothetical protein [Verrucomicrobiae bacterium]
MSFPISTTASPFFFFPTRLLPGKMPKEVRPPKAVLPGGICPSKPPERIVWQNHRLGNYTVRPKIMTNNELLTLVFSGTATGLSAIAIVTAALASKYQNKHAQKLATTHHAAEEAVAADLAMLAATMRNIMQKVLFTLSMNYKNLKFDSELARIQAFSTSTTAFGFYSYIGEVSGAAQAAGKRAEEWRLFFTYLVDLEEDLALAPPASRAMTRAADIERLLCTIGESELKKIENYVAVLANGMPRFSESSKGNVIFDVLLEQSAKDRDKAEQDATGQPASPP